MEYLEIDLNEIASNSIKNKIESLENVLKSAREDCVKLKDENTSIKAQIKSIQDFSFISEELKSNFAKIGRTKETDDSYEKSVNRNRYEYISSLMYFMFRVKSTYQFYEAGLWRNLAINFYNNKKELISIIKALGLEDELIKNISAFKMPVDFDKTKIMKYVQNPHYCTNGAVYGIGGFYMRSDGNTPHDLYQANEFILDDDVFKEVLKTIKSKKANYYYLFTIPLYIDTPKNKVQELGELLINEKHLKGDQIRTFISNNLHYFNSKTLDFFYEKVTTDNQFSMFHWEAFPIKYQFKYLNSCSIDEVLKYITAYSCKWTVDEKNSFLKDYYSKYNLHK